MTFESFTVWMENNPMQAFAAILLISIIVFFIARTFLARALFYFAQRTENLYDDIIVESLRPFRIAYLAPLYVIYSFAFMLPESETLIQRGVLFLALWVLIITLISLLNALNTIYESRENFSGVSIQGYLDLVKLLFILVGIILSISLATGQSPLFLLSGLGALTAVLLIVFRDTLLSLVASIQISASDLVKKGDWLEVPSFVADGEVIDMSLHRITIQNWDKTISIVPTYKLLETPYKNWRGMSESGGRRMKRAINIDLRSIHFLTSKEKVDLKKIELLKDQLEDQRTNVGAFRAYSEAFLRGHPGLHQKGMTLLVRQLAPGPLGLPIELYAFTKSTIWTEFEQIQAEIIEHLIAITPQFGLKIFQKPSGGDFAKLAS